MSLESIQYKINRFLPYIILSIVLIVISVIILVTINKQDNTLSTKPSTQQSGTSVDNVTIEETKNLILIEITIKGDWYTGQRQETYYDPTQSKYVTYDVTYNDYTKQLSNQTVQDLISYAQYTQLEEPPLNLDDLGDGTLRQIDDGVYDIDTDTDVYVWLRQQLNTKYKLEFIRINQSYVEIYLSKDDTNYRAIATNRYLIVSEYDNTIPN